MKIWTKCDVKGTRDSRFIRIRLNACMEETAGGWTD